MYLSETNKLELFGADFIQAGFLSVRQNQVHSKRNDRQLYKIAAFECRVVSDPCGQRCFGNVYYCETGKIITCVYLCVFVCVSVHLWQKKQ